MTKFFRTLMCLLSVTLLASCEQRREQVAESPASVATPTTPQFAVELCLVVPGQSRFRPDDRRHTTGEQIEQVDPSAVEQFLSLAHDDLRKLTAVKLVQENPGQTLQARLAEPLAFKSHKCILVNVAAQRHTSHNTCGI